MNKHNETHRYAEMFPDMASDEFDELVKDVRQNGLIEPITMLDGKVLDGRSRLKACIKIGIEPKFVEFDGQDPLMFAWSKNFARRHFTLKQRVILALQFKEMIAAAAKERMSKGGKISAAARNGQGVTIVTPLDEKETGKTVDKLAKMAGVSHGTMTAALMVERDAPKLLADIEAGKLSVGAAAKKIKAEKTLEGATGKPKGDWKKIEAYAVKLDAEISAVDLSGMVNLEVIENLQHLSDKIMTLVRKFNMDQGQ